jgi:glycosyltransferase involved in cell wall biosynthesis
MTPAVTLVVPCYNEADRFPADRFAAGLQQQANLTLLLVNDGSRDGTLDVLRAFEQAHPTRAKVLHLERNGGKAEAVRAGVRQALESGAALVGYWDADLATPLEELPRFVEVFESSPLVQIVLGSRVLLLGHRVRRSAVRHYLGRVFATAASLALNVPVYDTQCGAKVFRRNDMMVQAFAEPFMSRWCFDVELLFRLLLAHEQSSHRRPAHDWLRELPLTSWCDVAGSKLKTTDFARAAGDLLRMVCRYPRPSGHREPQ